MISIRALVSLGFAMVVMAVAAVASAQDTTPIPIEVTVILVWPTATETPAPTEGPSPTPTLTETPTPNYFTEATVEVAPGEYQPVALEYRASLGDVGIVVMLAALFGLLLFDILLRVKK
jgi:hypothetical protein